jgi:hypothetical protein
MIIEILRPHYAMKAELYPLAMLLDRLQYVLSMKGKSLEQTFSLDQNSVAVFNAHEIFASKAIG